MSETTDAQEPQRAGWKRWAWALPLIVFLGLGGLFWVALGGGNPHNLPSALIGKPVPTFDLPPIKGLADDKSFGSSDLATGTPTIVNVWASWCVPCREEYPILLQLAKRPGIRLFGINYKDNPDDARQFIGSFGNPFQRLGADRSGGVSLNWGVYGVPETYIVSGKGIITYRHIGPLTQAAVQQEILPRLAKLRQAEGLTKTP